MPQVFPKVTLLSHTPDPDATIAAAAKLCYSSSDIESLREKISEEEAQRFVKMLAGIGHQSPLEHTLFIFGIEGVSRALLAQITRHRIASFSVQSQRYVRISNFEYIVPPAIENDEKAKKEFNDAMNIAAEKYDTLTEILYKNELDRLLSEGVDEKEASKKAQKTAIEDARFVLPNAAATKMVMTMNARSLLHFFEERCCNRAQWEIREVAYQMLALVKNVAPAVFDKAGPPCVKGPCPEGKMTCGKAKEMREKYSSL